MQLSELSFPSVRAELLSYLAGLSDADYQYRAWVEHVLPDAGYDEFNYTVHFLYDDTGLAENPCAWIGLVLKNNDEASVVEDVVRAIDVLFEKYGVELSDKEYLEKKEWQVVMDTAKAALKVLLRDAEI